MARESTKHGPRLDDALAGETEPLERGAPQESRARDDLAKEDEFDPGLDSAVEARRELSRHLRPSVFPAERADLLAEAESQGAPDEVLGALRGLPESVQFQTAHEVWAALEGFDDVREAASHEPLTEGDR
jgi:hypothetical protein